jgi:hypothetical protein
MISYRHKFDPHLQCKCMHTFVQRAKLGARAAHHNETFHWKLLYICVTALDKFSKGPIKNIKIKEPLWWRTVCSYYVSRLDRHVTYYTSHMLYICTRLSLPILFTEIHSCSLALNVFTSLRTMNSASVVLT